MEKIITFDIWDTIIKRKCHPEEIKLATSKYIDLKYRDLLKEEYKEIYKILVKRDDIEAEECKKNKEQGNDDECEILKVFKILQNEIFKEKIEDISEELLRFEIEQEKRSIYINPEILPIFEEYKELKKYCISDFYMGSKSLQELLEYLELPVKIEKIYSSADYLRNKRTGNLFQIAQKELNLKSENHIHVGDNQFADIENAEKLGIKTIKTTKTEFDFMHKQGRKFNFDIEKIKSDSKQQEENNIVDENETKRYRRMFNVGVDIASILYFYVLSIVEYAIKNKIETVYYATREGETFIKIHEIIKENNPFGVEIPECEIIEVSRMATFSASMKEMSIEELMRLWSQYKKQSMKALFKTLAIDINEYTKYFEKYKIDISENIDKPWENTKIKELFVDDNFINSMNTKLAEKKQQLKEYFEKTKGIKNEPGKILMVDIGWRGTIQDNLAYIYDQKTIEGYYLTLFNFKNKQPVNTKKIAYINDSGIRENEIGKMITLLEWIYNPGTGSVVRYENGTAIRKAKKEELNVVKKYIKPMQDGMLEAAKIINEYIKYHMYEEQETKQYIYNVLKNVCSQPSKDIIEAYYSMVFNDTFGSDEHVEKEAKLTFFQKINIFKIRKILRKEYWKEAYIVYNEIGYMKLLLKVKAGIRKILRKG